MAPHPFLDRTPVAIAHRGGTGAWPENTMPAFEHAVSLGYRYVETDVHATADGVLVAFHDEELDRVTDRSGRIVDSTWDDLASVRVGDTESIPRLDDLLTTFPDLRINIDPKADSAVEPLIRDLRRHDALDRVCVGSFSDRRLAHLRTTLGPDLCTSAGPKEVGRLRLRSFGLPAGSMPSHCAQVPVSMKGVPIVDRRFVERCHQLQMHVHVWTIDDPEEMHRLLDLGVDGIMTDVPEVLADVFDARDHPL